MDEKLRLREAQWYHMLWISIQVFLTPNPSWVFPSISGCPIHSFIHSFIHAFIQVCIPSSTILANRALDTKENFGFHGSPERMLSVIFIYNPSRPCFSQLLLLRDPNGTQILLSSSLTSVWDRKSQLNVLIIKFFPME